MFSSITMLKKGILGFLTGLASVAVFGVVQALTSYNPIICSETVTENCTPAIISSAYYAIIPTLSALLVTFANWLKNRNK